MIDRLGRIRLALAILRGRCVHIEATTGDGDEVVTRTFLAVETTR